MADIIVEAFLIDDANIAKFGARGISDDQVLQVLDSEPLIIEPNRKARRASHIVIGRDYANNCLAVPIEPTDDPTLWRPVTAWYCKRGELADPRAAEARR